MLSAPGLNLKSFLSAFGQCPIAAKYPKAVSADPLKCQTQRGRESPDSPSANPYPTPACLKELHLVFHFRLFKSCVKLLILSAWATPQEYELWKYLLHCVESTASHLFVLKHPHLELKGPQLLHAGESPPASCWRRGLIALTFILKRQISALGRAMDWVQRPWLEN